MKNIYLELLEHQDYKSSLAIATVTAAAGSTPQKPGSSALFANGKLIAGTVGGGVAEKRVHDAANICVKSGKSQFLHVNLANDISQKEEAVCGGDIEILIDARPDNHFPVFEALKRSLEKREAGVLITMVTKYAADQVLINRYWMTLSNRPPLPESFLEKTEPRIRQILNEQDKHHFSRMELSVPGEEPSSDFILEAVFPLPKLIIAGAGHIGKALSHLGKLLDFDVTVIDDRSEFANPGNIPDAGHIIVKDIGVAMSDIEKNDDTYIVIVTRGHNDDGKALKPCIGSGAAYIGMIGSKPKVALMKNEFIRNSWASEEQWSKIHSPVGLEINSKTVEEIAVSIAAELVLVRSRNR